MLIPLAFLGIILFGVMGMSITQYADSEEFADAFKYHVAAKTIFSNMKSYLGFVGKGFLLMLTMYVPMFISMVNMYTYIAVLVILTLLTPFYMVWMTHLMAQFYREADREVIEHVEVEEVKVESKWAKELRH